VRGREREKRERKDATQLGTAWRPC
jgi:hypothetical protein